MVVHTNVPLRLQFCFSRLQNSTKAKQVSLGLRKRTRKRRTCPDKIKSLTVRKFAEVRGTMTPRLTETEMLDRRL